MTDPKPDPIQEWLDRHDKRMAREAAQPFDAAEIMRLAREVSEKEKKEGRRGRCQRRHPPEDPYNLFGGEEPWLDKP